MTRRPADDRGAALIAVVVLGLVMMILVATGLTVATSGLRQASGVQRSTSALDAAFAGVQDYLARVNLDATYVRYGNPASTFSATSAVAMDTANPAFGVGAGGSWASVPGSTTAGGTVAAKYRYEVDTTAYKSNGIVRLRVTGLAGERTRTLLAAIRTKGFVDYAYFTDYEIQDPDTYVNTDSTFNPSACVKYAWAGRSATCTNRMSVQFGKNDILYGDVHSNDTLRICGSRFSGVVETANTGSPLFVTPTGCPATTANAVRVSTLPMPSTNTAMLADAACVYTGPTRITYNGDGTMTVVSPWTQYTNLKGGPSNPTRCGALGGLHSAAGARVAQLDQDLLYVQNVPIIATDPNYWSSTAKPSWVTCIAADGTTTSAATGIGWTMGTGSSQIRYPLVGEAPATSWASASRPSEWNATTPAYGCRNGDLYVSGTVKSLTTAASENYVYVVGDIQYFSRSDDVLGLVGQKTVLIWNPMAASDDQPMLSSFNLEVDAAIVSVSHTFQVQNFDRGATRGMLEVFGSIAQKFRGPVGATDPDTGYTKGYQYDTLLKTVSPPKFLAPSATSFSVVRYAAVPTAFTPTGVAIP